MIVSYILINFFNFVKRSLFKKPIFLYFFRHTSIERRFFTYAVIEAQHTLSFEEALEWHYYLTEHYPEKYEEARKLNKARYEKLRRVRKRIENMLNNCSTVVFVTLTFTDQVLTETTAETRRKYVARFLKASGGEYIANVDLSGK